MSVHTSESFAPHANAAGEVAYHLTWGTKYRYKMFKHTWLFEACEASLRCAAQRHGLNILELSVMPDHVHCVVACPPRVSAADAARLLKGASAHDMFRTEPRYRLRYPRGALWARHYFVRSVGAADLDTVREYVRTDNDPRQLTLTEYN